MDTRQLLHEAEDRLQRHQVTEALERLHALLQHLLQADAPEPWAEIRCLLLLARAHHLQEDLVTARLYTDEAAAALETAVHLPAPLRAEIYLGLARLAPDVGRLRAGLRWAGEAHRLFSTLHLTAQDLDALHLGAIIANQLGHFAEARARLSQAERLLPGLDPGTRAQARVSLLNTEAHHAWYQGRLEEALTYAIQAQELADAHGVAKQRLYTRLLRANLLRELGRHAEARQGYADLADLLTETGFEGFRVWLWAHEAWLAVREADFDQARQLLFQALAAADRGQAASFNVFLAGVYSLTGRLADARDLLQTSLRFYQTSGDELSVFALRLLLAGVHLGLGQVALAEEQIALALDWAVAHNVDYFPHWWHPDLVAPVVVHALVVGIHPGMAERMLVTRLGPAAIPHLAPLRSHPDPTVARRAADAWALIALPGALRLPWDMDAAVQAVLDELLAAGVLRMDHLADLAGRLAGDPTVERVNPVLLATFGLYLLGADRRSIAERLGRSEATVRNYITLIYERFGLAGWQGSRRARREALRHRAEAAGYVDLSALGRGF